MNQYEDFQCKKYAKKHECIAAANICTEKCKFDVIIVPMITYGFARSGHGTETRTYLMKGSRATSQEQRDNEREDNE
jgi:hypothetical protein